MIAYLNLKWIIKSPWVLYVSVSQPCFWRHTNSTHFLPHTPKSYCQNIRRDSKTWNEWFRYTQKMKLVVCSIYLFKMSWSNSIIESFLGHNLIVLCFIHLNLWKLISKTQHFLQCKGDIQNMYWWCVFRNRYVMCCVQLKY